MKAHVLIVDDERFFSSLLEDMLRNIYEVHLADNGRQALEIMKKQPIDLVLLDILMPDMDGYEVCRQIKKNEALKAIPVIFLTVKSDIDDEVKGFNVGAADYLIKPVSTPIVLARCATQIALAKANKVLRQQADNLEALVAERTVELNREIARKQQAYQKLHYLANYDSLTQLPNRNLLKERLAYVYKQAQRNKNIFSVLLIDLDRFKQVNDSLGHHIGDLLLAKVGARLSECLRGMDTIARLGGDEFVVLLTELKKSGDAALVAKKIIAAIETAFILNGHTVYIGCSIGISSYPDDGEDFDAMLRYADMAMYAVKANGKNNYAFFSSQLATRANQKIQLEEDLHRALGSQAVFLYYQPVIDLQTQAICGVEALLRWHHPIHGMISPEEVIKIAEESDFIFELGEWILEQACYQFSLWQQQGLEITHIAINMSTRQFSGKMDSFRLLESLIQKYSIPSAAIQLEITESLMLEDSHDVMNMLEALRNLGMQISVDDFGTGYSSLSYLRRFPVDILKIDQSFIRDLYVISGSDTLIKAIIAMAHSLGLKVIAEGVETQEQLDFLKQHQCDIGQGYYFSRPVSVEDIQALLLTQKRVSQI